jgi:hypothetical protein
LVRADLLGAQATFQSGEGKYKPVGMAIQNKNFNHSRCRQFGENRGIFTQIQLFLRILAAMDDFKIWFYLILGAIYLISRLRKKNGSSTPSETYRPETPASEYDNQPADKPKPLTFDELLREITQAKEPQQPTYQPTSIPKTDYVDYDDDLKEEGEDLENTGYEEYRRPEVPSRVYEEAKAAAFYRPSLEETLKIQDTVVNFSKFKVFEEDKKRNLLEEYTTDLRDPEGLKKAVVLSEILNRRF